MLKKVILALIFVVVFSILSWAVILASKSPEIRQMVVLATTHQPETFTELYFENSANLPKIIKSRENYKFTFTLHNLENKDMNYPYVVYAQRGTVRAVINQGILTVKNNDFKSVEETMGPLNLSRKEIIVELTDKKQIISFWMGVK